MTPGKLYKITYPTAKMLVSSSDVARNKYLGRPVVYLGPHFDGVGHRLLLNGNVISVDPAFIEFLEEIP